MEINVNGKISKIGRATQIINTIANIMKRTIITTNKIRQQNNNSCLSYNFLKKGSELN